MTHRSLRLLLPLLVLALPACVHPPEPRYVRAADIGKSGALDLEMPLVIEFQEGDTIPLDLTLDGPFVTSPEGAQPIPLRVKRHFFLRIDKDGLRASADGKTFDARPAAPGRFQIGVGATKQGGVQAHIAIRTPTPSGLAP